MTDYIYPARVCGMIKKLLELRKQIKKKKPTFKRPDYHKWKRLGTEWRKPKGRHHKVRKRKRGSLPSPSYSSPAKVRGLHASGMKEKAVYNASELENMNSKTDVIRIGKSVGKRKRLVILEKAKLLGIRVLNPGLKTLNAIKKMKEDKKKKETEKKEKKSGEKEMKKGADEKATETEKKEVPKEKQAKKLDKKEEKPKKTTAKTKEKKQVKKQIKADGKTGKTGKKESLKKETKNKLKGPLTDASSKPGENKKSKKEMV